MTTPGPTIVRPDVWGLSWRDFKIHGCSSPHAFGQKLLQVPQADPPVLRNAAAIFIDILRATTTFVAIAAAGCDGIYVDVKPKDRRFRFMPPLEGGTWVYGGEQYGHPILGETDSGELVEGIIDNSPLSVREKMFTGKSLRFFSSNGARALNSLASASFRSIHALSFANIDATVRSVIAQHPERVWVTCGGFHGAASLEDSVAAGFAIKRLLDVGFAGTDEIDDEAEAMLILALHFSDDTGLDEERLVERLGTKQVARLINPFGHINDVRACVRGEGLQHGMWDAMRNVSLVADTPNAPLLIAERRG